MCMCVQQGKATDAVMVAGRAGELTVTELAALVVGCVLC